LQQPFEGKLFGRMSDEALFAGSLDLSACCLNHPSIRNAGWTSRFAATAGKAAIEMLNVGVGDGSAIHHGVHLVDTASRRIHFNAQFPVSRTGIQAEAAMYTLIEIKLAWP
jgi:hypothetical protein